MKRFPHYLIVGVLTAFGLLTVFLTGSIIFDLFGVREREGNYVLLVVWANLFSGILFLTAAFGFLKYKQWASIPLMVSLAVLVLAFAGLLLHIRSGAPYETRTVGAMIFRITLNLVLAYFVHSGIKKQPVRPLVKSGMLLLLPLALLAGSCGRASEDGHDHHATDEAHHHANEGVDAVALNNGEKWKADEHTLSVVREMKAEVSEFERSRESNYKVLGDSLTHHLNVLIKGCTMKGPAHDELHKWLGPLTEQVKELSVAEGHDASEVKEQIKASLQTFDNTFE